MLTHIIYLAIAIYYKKRNPQLGLQILQERWSTSKFPTEFSDWWSLNRNTIFQQCEVYSDKLIRFTYPGCWDYPEPFLKNLDTPPLLLTYMGTPNWSATPNLSVVGSRKISQYTKEWINSELFSFLEKSNVTVVSGGARGVDQAAHLCALRAGRPTFVFLPSGLDRLYPRDLSEWKKDIINSGGAFVSEYWPDEDIKKHYFIERNRLIAALANSVLIAQGERRSGTMLTAKWALDLGRDLFTIPGHPMDPSFSGNLDLIRTGIQPIIDRKDLEAALQNSIGASLKLPLGSLLFEGSEGGNGE